MAKEYEITITNNSAADTDLTLFQKNQVASQQGNIYTFTTPYTANYFTGESFTISAQGQNFTVQISSTTTREDLITALNALNIGQWKVDPSIANNIFSCFAPSYVLDSLSIDLNTTTVLPASSITGNSFTANWNSVTGALGYKITVATDPNFTSIVPGFNDLDVGNVLTYNITGLSSGTTYYYRVKVYDALLTSDPSNSLSATTSGIPHWNQQIISIPNVTLKSVYFTDANNGWACGVDNFNNPVILNTSNGGTSWASQQVMLNVHLSLPFVTLNSIQMTDANNGWACGVDTSGNSILVNTINGGAKWYKQTTSLANTTLYSIYFIDANTGWFCGYNTTGIGIIFKTTDGGSSWNQQNSGISLQLNSIYFVNSNLGFCVGASGIVLKTINGGTNWTSPLLDGNTKNSVFFINSNIGWWCGIGGKIYKTINGGGGTGWTQQNSGTIQNLNSIFFIDSNNGWCVGNSGTILVTTNGGLNWNFQVNGTLNNLNSIYILSSLLGYCTGNNSTILKYS